MQPVIHVFRTKKRQRNTNLYSSNHFRIVSRLDGETESADALVEVPSKVNVGLWLQRVLGNSSRHFHTGWFGCREKHFTSEMLCKKWNKLREHTSSGMATAQLAPKSKSSIACGERARRVDKFEMLHPPARIVQIARRCTCRNVIRLSATSFTNDQHVLSFASQVRNGRRKCGENRLGKKPVKLHRQTLIDLFCRLFANHRFHQ